jgi:putative phosphoribosyl transferase
MRFRDRRDAGRQLAGRLGRLAAQRPVVVGLPRGGVPVAHEIARALGAPLDVVVVRKLGHPSQPELGVGAIGEGGVRLLNERLIHETGVRDEQLDPVIDREAAELERRVRRYRGDRPATSVADRTVVVVDDGLATGFTAWAAVEVLRRHGAARIVLAVPVAPVATVERLRAHVDELVCLETPETFWAIGQFYDDFDQVTDEEVTALLAADGAQEHPPTTVEEVLVDIDGRSLPGTLHVPAGAVGIVLFAHGSGSSRHSPRNVAVARVLQHAGLATLLFDLLTAEEADDRAHVFDVALLAERLVTATRWIRTRSDLAGLPIGYFGASTGAAAALWASAEPDNDVAAIVSRGGRPDLAGDRLAEVNAPTLLIVGGRDEVVRDLNERARRRLRAPSRIEVVPRATHLFEEPGALERVAELAADWFWRHLHARPA